jgi:peptidoglycan/xylan/chitin deacetylase (PgdA/CDA1 family)
MDDRANVASPPRRSRREQVADLLSATGLLALLLRVPSWRGVAVLSYHRIGDRRQSDLHRGLFSADAGAFERQLRILKSNFRIIMPDQLEDSVRAGRDRSMMITFDDGYRDLHANALPVLEATGVKATMFLCSGLIDGTAAAWWDEIAWMIRHRTAEVLPAGSWGEAMTLHEAGLEPAIDALTRVYWTLRPEAGSAFLDELAGATGSGRRPVTGLREDWITWEMARELRAAGHQIGAHTLTHPILARLSPDEQQAEIAGSVERIASEVGERPRWLAYPVGTHGTFDERTKAAALAAGIELAFSNYGGVVTRRTAQAHDVRRLASESLRTEPLLRATLALPQVFARVAV